jgi:hypothetical protein
VLPRAPPERGAHVRAGGAERGHERREHPRREGHDEREPERARVEPDLVGARHVARQRGDDGAGERPGERRPERAGERGHDHPLGDELPDEAGAPRAHGGAHRELALAPRRAHERQPGGVDHGDDQHHAHGGEQQQ